MLRKMLLPRTTLLLLSLIVMSLVLPVVAQAQSGGGFELPDTAVETAELIIAFLTGFLGVGQLTNVLVEALKKINLPFLGPDKKYQIADGLAELVVIIVGALLSFAATEYVYPFAQYLDQIGLWPVFVAAWPFARWLYWQKKQAGKVLPAGR